MNRKLLIHLCILIALICMAAYVWIQTAPPPEIPPEEQKQEMKENLFGELVPVDRDPEGLSDAARTLIRLAVCLVVGVYAGAMFLAYGLPAIVFRATTELYGSDEAVESDPAHDARNLFAQGDYEGAIELYRGVAEEHPDDRFPWVEISKIQNDNLEDPDAAIATLKEGLESHEWTVNNAAFFLFRIADLYEKEKGDMDTTIALLHQIVELFPETRHSANATHRLRDLGAI